MLFSNTYLINRKLQKSYISNNHSSRIMNQIWGPKTLTHILMTEHMIGTLTWSHRTALRSLGFLTAYPRETAWPSVCAPSGKQTFWPLLRCTVMLQSPNNTNIEAIALYWHKLPWLDEGSIKRPRTPPDQYDYTLTTVFSELSDMLAT